MVPVVHVTPARRKTFRLSQLTVDRDGMRPESLAAVRDEIDATGLPGRPVHVDVHPYERTAAGRRASLEDGRHRVTVALELSIGRLAALVTVYGPRGGRIDRYPAILVLDHWPDA